MKTKYEKLFDSLLVIFNVVIFGGILNTASSIFENIDNRKEELYKNIKIFEKFFVKKNISFETRNKIMRYM